MKRTFWFIFFDLFILFELLTVPAAAKEKNEFGNCVINAIDWGLMASASDIASTLIGEGKKPIYPSIGISNDAGYGPSFILFKIPSFNSPAIYGTLRLRVYQAHSMTGDAPYLPIVLYDVNNPAKVLQPLWSIEDWSSIKQDFMSGRVYGNFKVRESPADDGVILEIPLSYDAMYDMNIAAGDKFAIAIAPGQEYWVGEGDAAIFSTPNEGGVAQIEITTANGKDDNCGKFHMGHQKAKSPY